MSHDAAFALEPGSSRYPDHRAPGLTNFWTDSDTASTLRAGLETSARRSRARNWHFDLGLRVSHTKLAETEQTLDRRLDIPLKADVLGLFHHPTTTIDRKTDLAVSSFYLGIGRQEKDRLTWTLYAGGGAASDNDHQRFVIANLDVAFHYLTLYTGLAAEFYLWGTPLFGSNLTWKQRLECSRPYFLTGFEAGFVHGKGTGHYSLAPLRLYEDSKTVRDWIFSYKLGLGWRIPLGERWSASLAGDYSFHFYRPEEYNSWNLISGLRYRF